MATETQTRQSFSPWQRWGIGFNVFLVIVVVLSLVVMVNYLNRKYYLRFHCSTTMHEPLSPLTVKFLHSITNQVKVTVYYDKEDPLYTTVDSLLKEYHLANPKIMLQTVDYLRDPGAAQRVKADYKLAALTDKNLIIFDCEGKFICVDGNSLAKYVAERLPGKDIKLRRKPTTFEGEKAFTSTLIAVTNPKPLNTYFLQGHGEYPIDSTDENYGCIKLTAVLQENFIRVRPLSLAGTNAIPADCNLLVIDGPTEAVPAEDLAKIDQWLNQGGRLWVLFNAVTVKKDLGLEMLLAKWGVDVGHDIIKDLENSYFKGTDLVVSQFSDHPITNPLLLSRLQLILPRSIGKLRGFTAAADAPRVQEIAFSGPKAFAEGEPGNVRAFPLMVAVEKGAVKAVLTEHAATRLLVTGDSIFLGNHQIDSAANRDFAGFAVNWLLDRGQLLGNLGPQSILEYRLVMTQAQLSAVEWILLAGMPGAVLFVGGLVSLRRRS